MRNLKLVFTSLSILFLSSCTTGVNVLFTDFENQVVVVFKDEIKKAIVDDPSTDQALLDFLANLSGNTVSRSANESTLSYTTSFTDRELPSDIASVSIKRNTERVELTFSQPTRLLKAIDSSLKNNLAKDVLESTYKKNILFNVKYETTNKILSAETANGTKLRHSRHSVGFEYTLDKIPDQVVVIQSSYDYNFLYYLFVIFPIGVIFYKYVVKRRKLNL